jgi:hypothetical protein
LSVCCDLGLVDGTIGGHLMGRCAEVRRMLFGLRRALIATESRMARERQEGGGSAEVHDPKLMH